MDSENTSSLRAAAPPAPAGPPASGGAALRYSEPAARIPAGEMDDATRLILAYIERIGRRKCAGMLKAVENFHAIMHAVEAGATITEAVKSAGVGYHAFAGILKRSPAHDARYRRASRTRQAGPNARSRGRGYSQDEIEAAVAAVAERSESTSDLSRKKIGAGGPHFATLKARGDAPLERALDTRAERFGIQRHAFTDEAYDRVVAFIQAGGSFRKIRRSDRRDQPKIWAIKARMAADADFAAKIAAAIAARPKVVKEPKKVWRDGLHQEALQQVDIYRLARAALPRGLEPDVRDDVVSSVVLAVLEGTIRPDEITAKARSYMRKHFQAFGVHSFESLDRRTTLDENLSIVETITTDDLGAFA